MSLTSAQTPHTERTSRKGIAMNTRSHPTGPARRSPSDAGRLRSRLLPQHAFPKVVAGPVALAFEPTSGPRH